MRRVLMVSFQFPPMAGSSGVQRALRFAQQLPALGWSPSVLTAHPRAHAHTGEERIVALRDARDRAAVPLGHRGGDIRQHGVAHGAGMLDDRLAAGHLGGDQPAVGFEHRGRLGRPVLLDVGQHAGDALGGELAIDEAQLEKLPGELLDVLVAGGHGAAY